MVSTLFSEAQKAAVAEEIRMAEAKTSGEVVVALADASNEYGRASGLFAFCVTLFAFLLSWGLRDMSFGLLILLVILVVSYQVGLLLAESLPAIKMLFVDPREVNRQVERAAAVAYQRYKVGGTVDSTGILIYVSLLERRVRVVGDGAISQKLQDKDWQAVCVLVTQAMAQDRPSEGLISAIRAAGELLAAHFPKKLGDTNELSNTLNLIDGIP